MAFGDVIARLAVNLTLQTAAFEKGATKTEKRFNQMKRKFADFSKSIAIGGAAVTGAVLSVNKVFSDLAGKAKEIDVASRVAGESFEEFQRQAYGAKMVGIEVDKLGDIFKDVRDRIGDFTQTGGGPMADFFENIAPKVGVTAKAFEGLGGKASLQLYYDSLKRANVSQEDMVFYLEAMASDATNLIPLLENGGAAWERYGDKASVITEDQRGKLQRYTDSMSKLDQSLEQLKLTLVDSGLIDGFADLAANVAAAIGGFSGAESAATRVGSVLVQNLEAMAAKGGVAKSEIEGLAGKIEEMAASGKVDETTLASYDNLVTKLQNMGAISTEEANNYRAAMNDIRTATQEVTESEEQSWQERGRSFREFSDGIEKFRLDYGRAMDEWMAQNAAARRQIADWVTGIGTFLDNLATNARQSMQRMYVEVKTWLQDKLGGVLDWVTEKVKAVERAFYWMADQVVFNSHVPDMVDEIGKHMARLQSLMVDPATKATEKTDQAFRDLAGRVSIVLDRLYPKFAALRAMQQDIADIDAWQAAGQVSEAQADEWRFRARGGGREIAVSDSLLNAPSLIEGMEKVGTKLQGLADHSREQTVRIAKTFKDMADDTLSALDRMADAIKGGGFLGILQGVLGLGLQLGGIGAFGSKIAANINKSVPGYAGGTNFHPGGLAMVGERGPELVSMPRGSRVFTNRETMGMMGGGSLEIRLGHGLEAEWLGKSAAQTVQIVQATGPALVAGASVRARRDAARPIMPGGATG